MVVSDKLESTTKKTIVNIANIINSKNIREEISEECYQYACQNFLKEKVAADFRKDIERVANTTSKNRNE